MNRTSRPSGRKRSAAPPPQESRRRFLKLVAAGSAALLASPMGSARALAATRPVRSSAARGEKSTLAPAVRAEIKSQKDSTATTLKTVRDYAMAPGAEMAFVFRPMKPARGDAARSVRGAKGRGQ